MKNKKRFAILCGIIIIILLICFFVFKNHNEIQNKSSIQNSSENSNQNDSDSITQSDSDGTTQSDSDGTTQSDSDSTTQSDSDGTTQSDGDGATQSNSKGSSDNGTISTDSKTNQDVIASDDETGNQLPELEIKDKPVKKDNETSDSEKATQSSYGENSREEEKDSSIGESDLNQENEIVTDGEGSIVLPELP